MKARARDLLRLRFARLRDLVAEAADRLRDFLFIACVVVCVDWGMWWVAQHHLSNTIYNASVPTLAIVFLLAVVDSWLLLLLKGRVLVIGCALSFGGVFANTVGGTAFGPVADYIPVPLLRGWECNLADIAISSGSVCILLALCFSARTLTQSKRVSVSKTLTFSEWGNAVDAPDAQ